MSAVFSAPYSAKKPIEALLAEISELVWILRETRAELHFTPYAPNRSAYDELKLREWNCLMLLSGLRAAAIYELDTEAAAAE